MRMRRHHWELTKDNDEVRPKLCLHRFQDRMQRATGRTLKVTKLFQHHRRLRIAEHLRRNCAEFRGDPPAPLIAKLQVKWRAEFQSSAVSSTNRQTMRRPTPR